MTTVSDDGERTCPLCLEEMDLTDQQLKPCKCGYEICLLCWHQLNELAEKEGTEGRCPACRTPYDKERIVKMAANCERVIAEVNAAKKQKSQKGKPKPTAEAKKHLSSVRVIQRNLVYIIGLPSNLCDESILERKEYFGQYGKVLKVSISRPSGVASQQTSSNNTFSVYITYAKEDEAVRCIQAVHNYILDGKPLRACFGTTKYCHAWLKNMSCNNPDCLYLHGIGGQEDSFTKDEIISAYTRVPRVVSNSSLRRGGNVLPLPVDDFTSASKVHPKSILNSTSNQVKGSPTGSGASKPTMLPAAASWGLRGAKCRPAAGLAGSTITSVKHKVNTNSHSSLTSLLAESTRQSSPWSDEVDPAPRLSVSGMSTVASSPRASMFAESSKQSSAYHDDIVTKAKLTECRTGMELSGHSFTSKKLASRKLLNESSKTSIEANYDSGSSAWDDDTVATQKIDEERLSELLRPASEKRIRIGLSSCDNTVDSLSIAGNLDTSSSSVNSPVNNSEDMERRTSVEANSKAKIINPATKDGQITDPTSQKINQHKGLGSNHVIGGSAIMEETVQALCLDLSSMKVDGHGFTDMSYTQIASGTTLGSSEMPRQDQDSSQVPLRKGSVMLDEDCIGKLKDPCTRPFNLELAPDVGELALHVDSQRLRLLDSCNVLSSSPCAIDSNSAGSLTDISKGVIGCNEPLLVGQNMNRLLSPRENLLSKGHIAEELVHCSEIQNVVECTEINSTLGKVNSLGIDDNIGKHNKSASVDIASESSIISDILSLDFDPWDDSTFASLLGEAGKQEKSISLSNSLKSQSSNQSRFSFAQQEIQTNVLDPPVNEKGHAQNYFSQNGFKDEFHIVAPFNAFENTNNGINGDRTINAFENTNTGTNSNKVISSDRSAGMPKAKVAAPPGFSAPSRAPPPGFSAQDRFNWTHEAAYLGNCALGSSSMGNHYQSHLAGNSYDIEFIDPAILAVGRGLTPLGTNNSDLGLKSIVTSQFSSSVLDPKLHLLMQQSFSPHNVRMLDHGDRFLPLNDAYITSQLLSQNHGNTSPFAQLSIQQSTNSHFTNSQWNGWNSLRSESDIGINEIMRNERFDLNSYYSANEEHKFHIPNNNLYNRAFGM